MPNEEIFIIKNDEQNPTELVLIAKSDFYYIRNDSNNIITIEWYINDEYYTTDFETVYEIVEYKNYIIKAIFKRNGITFFEETKNINLSLELDFSVSIRYGKTPLTVYVKDITDYSNYSFVPRYWTWCISGMNLCSSRKEGINYRYITFPREGIYSIRMTVSDGITSYTVLKRDIINVYNEVQNTQLEFAESSGDEIRRHTIKSSHSTTDNKNNKLEFFIWGTEVAIEEEATDKILEINGDNQIITKNIYPFEENTYDMGSEDKLWRIIFLNNLEVLKNAQSKILMTWSGK